MSSFVPPRCPNQKCPMHGAPEPGFCGWLRRRSWLVSKQARCLRRQLDLFTAYRNWYRPRTNHEPDGRAPGVVMQLLERNLEAPELLARRQDWRGLSIHPTSADGHRTCGAAA